MRFIGILFLLTTISTLLYGQVRFEKGYFVSASGVRTECLIKNEDWAQNPTEFSYKLTEDGAVQVRNLQDTNEFGVTGFSRYVKYTLDIDQSPTDMNNLSQSASPEFEKHTVFLETLVQGAISLYSYDNKTYTRYFVQRGRKLPEQLIFRRYGRNRYDVWQNEYYKVQLYEMMPCEVVTQDRINTVIYAASQLRKFFKFYYNCTGEDYTVYGERSAGESFHLTVKPMVRMTQLEVTHGTFDHRNHSFPWIASATAAIELEYVLPFRNGVYSLMVDPTYHEYNHTLEAVDNVAGETTIDFSAVEVPVSLRRYFYPSEKFQMYLQGGILMDFTFNSNLEYELIGNLDNIRSGPTIRIGGGLRLFNRFVAEVNYSAFRNVLSNVPAYQSNYQVASFAVGYRVF